MTRNGQTPDGQQQLRVDKWLWFARFFKTRGLAARLCEQQRIRVNRTVIGKAHHPVRVGDVLTIPQPGRIRVVRVVALGQRRGPAAEACLLYEEIGGDDEATTAAP
jgi:ribosome-associated heat shock protein Hsp15